MKQLAKYAKENELLEAKDRRRLYQAGWAHDRVVLRPENAASPPFTLDLKSEQELQMLGEFVTVLQSQDVDYALSVSEDAV